MILSFYASTTSHHNQSLAPWHASPASTHTFQARIVVPTPPHPPSSTTTLNTHTEQGPARVAACKELLDLKCLTHHTSPGWLAGATSSSLELSRRGFPLNAKAQGTSQSRRAPWLQGQVVLWGICHKSSWSKSRSCRALFLSAIFEPQ